MIFLTQKQTTDSRAIREFRSAVSKAIANLLTVEDAIDQLSWEQLDQLPSWILLNDADLLVAIRRVGIAGSVGFIKQCIDGNVIRELASIVDADYFGRVMRLDVKLFWQSLVHGDDLNNASLSTMVEQAGASILLATIESPELANVLSRRFSMDASPVEFETAYQLLQLTQQHWDAPALTEPGQPTASKKVRKQLADQVAGKEALA